MTPGCKTEVPQCLSSGAAGLPIKAHQLLSRERGEETDSDQAGAEGQGQGDGGQGRDGQTHRQTQGLHLSCMQHMLVCCICSTKLATVRHCSIWTYSLIAFMY